MADDTPQRRIRVRPAEIEVPPGNPFRHDLLNRQPDVEVLSDLIAGIEGPSVIAVDAPWGTGKSTFLAMLAQHLTDCDHPVVSFNAWETDFVAEPFVVLSAELTDQLEGLSGLPASFAIKLKRTKAAAVELIRRSVPALIRIGTGGLLDVHPAIEGEAGEVLAGFAEARLRRYSEAKRSITAFRGELASMAGALREDESSTGPLAIVIDELDRCRPTYAIELLETAKHLFSVDDVVFVLALDRDELAHSIRAVYGSGFDGPGYLRRFFDVDYRLPIPDRRPFTEALLEGCRIREYVQETQDRLAKRDLGIAENMFTSLLVESSAGLRDIAQGVHRFGLMLGSLPRDKEMFVFSAGALAILRTLHPGLYRRFLDGRASDLEVVDAIFADPGLRQFRGKHVGELFAAAIAVGALELKRFSEIRARIDELEDKYAGTDLDPLPEDLVHARGVATMINALSSERSSWMGIGFRHAISRLEQFSPDVA